MTVGPRLSIGQLSSELRSLRLRLIRYEQRHRDGWSADLEAYDRRLVEAARMLAAKRGDSLRVEEASNTDDPDHELLANGALLPGPGAILAGPTFAEWLDATS